IAARMITKDEVDQLGNGSQQDWLKKGYIVLAEEEKINDGYLATKTAEGSYKEIDPPLPNDFDVVIAELPFVDALAPEESDRAFYDMEHREHRTLFAALGTNKTKKRWLKQNGFLVTSFSGL